MFDLVFRERFAKHTISIVVFFERYHVTANLLTLIGLILGLIASFFVATGNPVAAIFCWWVGRLFDGFDGLVARRTGTDSPGGAFFDLTADMIAYGAMIIGFHLSHPQYGMGWSLILYGYLLVTVTALALGSQEEKAGLPNQESRNLRLGVGFAEAGETGCVYTILCLFPSYTFIVQQLWISMLFFTFFFRCFQSKKIHKLVL
ncbi:MAG: CDP-alcohol phosphatidyltransferase family protein [Oligoflexales bacterium]